ncbi:porin family protein [Dyadobacter sp. CY312]|uniref:porin family protein n=1 Tax=Dyadobacter sp. CY312 TaxID=2907303 RepID=UPI001F1A9F7F|nr:porin family protein [Dyadobacter sp. CY312]MCE7038851.1 PorT family protein [Dyadobacter sp. CY312]
MKKLYTIIIVAIMLQLSHIEKVDAQISLGFRAGANIAQFSFHTSETYGVSQSKTRLNGAFRVNVPLNSLFKIQLEPGYTQLGTKYLTHSKYKSSDGTTEDIEKLDVATNYFELPLLLQLNPRLGRFETIINLGPEIRYRTGKVKGKSSYSYSENGTIVEEDESGPEDDFDEDFSKFDYGIAGGVGVALPIKSFKVFAEARYHFGLTNLVNKDNYQDFDGTVQNRAVSLNVGVLYSLQKK